MKKHWRQDNLDRINAVDVNKLRDEAKAESKKEDNYDSTYPRLCGALQHYFGEAKDTANALMEELREKTIKIDALQWAAESVLNDTDIRTYCDRQEVYEMLYEAAEIVEKAIRAGMTDDQLREHLKDGVTDEEYKHGRFLEAHEICKDCEEFCGEAERCEICQEIFEEANSQEV